MKINNHLLEGEGVTFRESPNQSGAFDAPLPDTIIMHYTAGGSLEGSVSWLCNPTAKASAHIVIGRDGSVVQLVPFNMISWHAGRSRWKDRVGLNKFSIGIELDNAGILSRQGDRFLTSFGSTIPADQAYQGVHRNETVERYWHAYTEIQINKAAELCSILVSTYNVKDSLGHEEISPGRKTDPGPAFPLDQLRDKLVHDPSDEDAAPLSFPVQARVSSSSGLSIRAGAGTSHQTVAEPLPNGKTVTILEERNGWYRVQTSIEGWVSAKHIEKTAE